MTIMTVEREEFERLEAELTAAREENKRLRAALAQSDQPCAYCSLPADEWAKCESGFPGCDRADDAMGCPELGARFALDTAERQLAEARAALGAIRSSLPDDPGLNKPWSPAIAIIDEALTTAKEQDDG